MFTRSTQIKDSHRLSSYHARRWHGDDDHELWFAADRRMAEEHI